MNVVCPHGVRIEDIGIDPLHVHPQRLSEVLRAMLFACPACAFDARAYIPDVRLAEVAP